MGQKSYPTTSGQHLLWHKVEKKKRRTMHRIRMRKKEKKMYKKERRQTTSVCETLGVKIVTERKKRNKKKKISFYEFV